ncbi:hypothetical protein, partial [Photorhabdus khanii]|uniref:hypothetical protein n=1 Tax=Photorhabdus khanii TaxID=1004150 RepID=UPI001961A917
NTFCSKLGCFVTAKMKVFVIQFVSNIVIAPQRLSVQALVSDWRRVPEPFLNQLNSVYTLILAIG